MVLSSVTGCNKDKEVTGNQYVFGQDDQSSMFYNQIQCDLEQAESEKGYYFIKNQYIYFFDKDTKKVVPLCNKSDCLHDEETIEKRVNCNAYIPKSIDTTDIVYYNHCVYYIVDGSDTKKLTEQLVEVSEDGSAKEVIASISGGKIQNWQIHRGYIYYTINQYERDEDTGEEISCKTKIYQLKLHENVDEAELLYETKDGYNGMGGDVMLFYGDHAYFTTEGYAQEGEDSYFTTYHYNLVTKEMKELVPCKDSNFSHMFVYNNQLIYNCWYDTDDDERNGIYYCCDLNGEHRKEFRKTRAGEVLYTDGTYLYQDNYYLVKDNVVSFNPVDDKRTITVYNEKFEELGDIASITEKNQEFMEAGGTDYIFQIVDTDTGFEIEYIEKAKFKELKNKTIEPIVCYESKNKLE